MSRVVGWAIYAIVILDGYTATNVNSNTNCRWEFIHHHAILCKWYRQHTDVKVAVIQESKLTSNCKRPELHHSTKGPSSMPRMWFTHLDSHVNKLLLEVWLTRDSGRTSFGGVDHHDHVVRHGVVNTNVYIPLANSCAGIYPHSLGHLMITTDTLIRGYFNTHHSAWYLSSTDTRGTLLENMISGSNCCVLNWDSPNKATRQCQSISPRCLISTTISYHFHQLADEDEPRLRPSTNPH